MNKTACFGTATYDQATSNSDLTLLRTHTTRILRATKLLVYIHNTRLPASLWSFTVLLQPRNGRVILSWLGLPLHTWFKSTIFNFNLMGEVLIAPLSSPVWRANVHLDIFRMTGCVQSLFGSIPALCALGIDSQVDIQDVDSVERFGHTLHHYGLGRLSRIWRPFQYHFVMHLTDANKCKRWGNDVMEYMLLLFVDFVYVYIKDNAIVVCPSFKL